MTRYEIEQRVLEYLKKLPGWVRTEGRPSPTEELITNRVLDSIALLEFVTFVERLCGIDVPSDDITAANFNSTSNLLQYLETRAAIREEAS
jgi:acyl carrier protein